jgi:hypothetical protein
MIINPEATASSMPFGAFSNIEEIQYMSDPAVPLVLDDFYGWLMNRIIISAI